eukprot:m.112413 g.112413  ORF g.112413 m.112413 type:complete len:50 (+) comp10781_c0_seq3:222-371(+)
MPDSVQVLLGGMHAMCADLVDVRTDDWDKLLSELRGAVTMHVREASHVN